MKEYQICVVSDSAMALQSVEAEEITIQGFERLSFFLHPTLRTDPAADLWTVTERTTGFSIVAGVWGKEGAVLLAQLHLEETGDRLDDEIQRIYARTPLGIREKLGSLPEKGEKRKRAPTSKRR